MKKKKWKLVPTEENTAEVYHSRQRHKKKKKNPPLVGVVLYVLFYSLRFFLLFVLFCFLYLNRNPPPLQDATKKKKKDRLLEKRIFFFFFPHIRTRPSSLSLSSATGFQAFGEYRMRFGERVRRIMKKTIWALSWIHSDRTPHLSKPENPLGRRGRSRRCSPLSLSLWFFDGA